MNKKKKFQQQRTHFQPHDVRSGIDNEFMIHRTHFQGSVYFVL